MRIDLIIMWTQKVKDKIYPVTTELNIEMNPGKRGFSRGIW